MSQKLFTKSAFKQSLSCPTGLYYYRNPKTYANVQLDDEFLESLAEGGFQVGEAAKVYYEVPEENTIETLDYEGALAETRRLFKQENVRIAEAAFRYDNCFIRADILVKEGHDIKLIEVKSHSWDPTSDSFFQKRDPNCIEGGIMPYLYDVAFQKWVVVHALREMYSDEEYTVTAYLMMADKSKKAPIGGINQMFKIVEKDGRKAAQRTVEAASLVDTDPVVVAFDVDDICDRIVAGQTTEQRIVMGGRSFENYVKFWSKKYCDNVRVWSPISHKCFNCPFHRSPDDAPALRDGFRECWKNALGWTEPDFKRPRISDLNGRKDMLFKNGILFLEDYPVDVDHIDDGNGLNPKDRNLLIAGMLTGRNESLDLFRHNIHGEAYLNVQQLKNEMDSWVYPLHMIDFETSAVALPFYEGMRPYESVAFQFSHHIIRKSGEGYEIEHVGQFINVEKGHFPNFDFIRALKSELDRDGGSIFRYSSHENTILNHISEQLRESDESDKDELIQFISSITHPTKAKATGGPRDMIDLLEVVKRCFYHPVMRGSNSIKYVLPAVLNTSKFIQEKYAAPIYGSEIKSLNVPADRPIAWITFAEDGTTVVNPYKLLPPVSEYLDMDEDTAEAIGNAADSKIANGGAALTAYSELQFSDFVMSDALSKALLRYCELDTMAMVFIWEYFYNEVYG